MKKALTQLTARLSDARQEKGSVRAGLLSFGNPLYVLLLLASSFLTQSLWAQTNDPVVGIPCYVNGDPNLTGFSRSDAFLMVDYDPSSSNPLGGIASLCSGCSIGAKEEVEERYLAGVFCNSNTAATTELLANMPKPDQRVGIGNAHLRVTTDQEEAQYWFDQGLNYLHGFWYLEAYRAFEQVLDLDPKCAMGHWGIAMCQPGFGGDDVALWQNAINQAGKLSNTCTLVEKELIEALRVTVDQDVFNAKENWLSLATDFPDEPEAIAFASIMLRQIVQSEQESDAVKAILDKALERFPYHVGLLHYYVHLLEVRPDFNLAKTAAERLLSVAPNNSHLAHMSGHIYFQDGEYQKAANTFEAARTQELAYHLEQGIPPAIDQNYQHNLHYLSIVYRELELTRFATERE